MRPRYQNGQVEVRSDGKGEYYSGRYTVYKKDEAGKDVRTQPRPFLGYCSEISQFEAQERLQQLIRENQPGDGWSPRLVFNELRILLDFAYESHPEDKEAIIRLSNELVDFLCSEEKALGTGVTLHALALTLRAVMPSFFKELPQ